MPSMAESNDGDDFESAQRGVAQRTTSEMGKLNVTTSFCGETSFVGTGDAKRADLEDSDDKPNLVMLGFLAIWCVYLLAALIINFTRSWGLAVLTAIVVFAHTQASANFIEMIFPTCVRASSVLGKPALALTVVLVLVIIVIQVMNDIHRLQPLGGMIVLVLLCAIFSSARAKIDWLLVCKALLLQFLIGCFALSTTVGFNSVHAAGDVASDFLNSANAGSSFVFGSNLVQTVNAEGVDDTTPAYFVHFFAFKVMPTTIFFSSFISCMYYLGVLQALVRVLAFTLNWFIGSSALESVTAAGNVFLGVSEAPLLVRPFILQATRSELHAIMTAGMSTVAGGVMAAYIDMGIPVADLVACSVMSAPGSLAITKLFEPETEKPDEEADGTAPKMIEMPRPSEGNLIEAAGNGASIGVSLVANIVGMLIAFLGLVQAINQLLMYLGSLVGYENVTFPGLLGLLFSPLALLIGVPVSDMRCVGQLIGMKMFLNEFVAFGLLGPILKGQGNDECESLSAYSGIAATYALCGFANFGCMGIAYGGLSTMAPSRGPVISQLVFRAMIAGTCVSLVNACIAGILVSPTDDNTAVQMTS